MILPEKRSPLPLTKLANMHRSYRAHFVLSVLVIAVLCLVIGGPLPTHAGSADNTTSPTNKKWAQSEKPENLLVIHDGADPTHAFRLHAVPGMFSITWLPGIEEYWDERRPAADAAGPQEIVLRSLVLERVGSAGAPRFHTDRYRIVGHDGENDFDKDEVARLLSTLDNVLVASPLYALGPSGTGPWRAVTHRILLQLTGAEHGAALKEVVAELGGTSLERRGAAPNQWRFDIPQTKGPSQLSPVAIAMGLHRSPITRWAQVDWIQQRSERYVPDDPKFPEQWHLENTGQNDGIAGNDIAAVPAFDLALGDPEIIIAVMDSGVDLDHPDLAEAIVPGWDFINGDSNPSPGGSSHGTSVSGLAGAPANSIGVVGACPGCSIMPLRMLGTSDATEAEALDFGATNGAAVINNSWGPTDGTGVEAPIPAVMAAAIDNAVTFGRDGLGTVIFWAAGNGHPIDTCDLDGFVAYPSTIAVGASTDAGEKSSYSELCEELDLTAPSGGGGMALTTTNIGGYTNHFGGTSASSPVATGVGALLISAAPELPWTGVREVLRNTAQKIDPGDADYNTSGHSLSYGYGRVDAFAAVSAELAYLSVTPGTPHCTTELAVAIYAPDLDSETISVVASSPSEPDGETFVLARSGDGVFEGELALHDAADFTPIGEDELLGVSDGEELLIFSPDLEQEVALTVDCAAPVIGAVTLVELHHWGAQLSWETSEDAVTTLSWFPGENSTTGETYSTEHLVWALDLAPCTPHSANIEASDRNGNTATSQEVITWVTPGNPNDLPEDALEGADPCDSSTWYEDITPPDGEGCQCAGEDGAGCSGVGENTSGGGKLLATAAFLLPLASRRRRRRPPSS